MALVWLVNSRALPFLIAFSLCEIIFLLPIDGLFYSVVISAIFAATIKANNFKLPLEIALTLYSLLYFISALDYCATEYETTFGLIFPYAIKIIDLFIIIYLTVNKEKADERSSRDNSYFSGAWC